MSATRRVDSSAVYLQCFAHHGTVTSLNRKDNCSDNVVADIFFTTLKRELVPDTLWATREEARAALFGYIERWHNRSRRHSTIENRMPHDYA